MTGRFMVDRTDRIVRSEADMMAMWVESRVRCLGFVVSKVEQVEHVRSQCSGFNGLLSKQRARHPFSS